MEAWTPELVDQMLHALASIDGSLRLLVKQHQKDQPKAVATTKELNGKWGDPEVKSMPRFWTGESFSGRHYSECPPELLDLIADQQDWAASESERKDEKTDAGKPKAVYRAAAAAKARGWAKRKRDGWVGPVQPRLDDGPAWSTGEKAPPLPPWSRGEPDGDSF